MNGEHVNLPSTDIRESSPDLPTTTDVLIVGAGPTGLALAIALAKAGVNYLIIDKLEAGQNTSRAAVVHAHTLEALAPLGVSDKLASRGIKVKHFALRDGEETLVRLGFEKLPTPFAFLLMIPQHSTEACLVERLEELGGRVRRGVVAEGFDVHPDHVRAWVNAGGVKRSIDARYVVGADGMHSVVRKAAKIEFEGSAFEHSFVLADIEMGWSGGRKEVMLCFTPAGPLVIAPLPAERRYRIVAAMENAPEKPGIADIRDILARHGPKGAADSVTSLVWSSRFRLHHRLAERYRKGRMILMGDAAHAHSPAGGQGMNTGLVDAVVLGRLLETAVKQRRDEVLDAYERKRRPAAQKVLGLSGQLTHMAMTRGAFARWLRNRRLKAIGRVPPLRRKFEMNLSGLARRDDARI